MKNFKQKQQNLQQKQETKQIKNPYLINLFGLPKGVTSRGDPLFLWKNEIKND